MVLPRKVRLFIEGEIGSSMRASEAFLQRRLYLLVIIGFIIIGCFMGFLVSQYHEFQALHDRQDLLQRSIDRVGEAHLFLRSSARVGAATPDPKWELLHQEKEFEMDALVQKLITLYAEEEQTNLGFDLQVLNVQLLEIEKKAFYLVRDGRNDLAQAARLLDSPLYDEKKKALETTIWKTEKRMQEVLKDRLRRLRNRTAAVSLALLLLSLAPVFPIVRVLRLTRRISLEREVAERQLARLNSCLLSFGSNSMINIQSLVDLCGELLEADGVAYQRIEGDSVCVVASYGSSQFCRPAESLKGSLVEAVINTIYSVPLYTNSRENPELHDRMPTLASSNCKTFVAQLVRSGQDVLGVLCVFYKKEIKSSPENLRFVTIVTSAITPEERRHTAVETLRTSEANYRLMADNATDLIMRATMNGTMVYISPACQKLLGYTSKELHGGSLERLWHPDDIKICWEKSTQGYLTLMEGTTVHRMKNKHDEYQWFETVSRQVVNNEERWGKEMILVSREITERKRAEDALEREREQLSVTLRSITDGVISTDLDNRVVLMNRVAEALTGWTLAEAQGKLLPEIFCVPAGCQTDCSRKETEGGGTTHLQGIVLESRNGDKLSIEGSCAPILHFDDSVMGHLVVFRDQTEKQRLQAQIALSSKLQSIGQLAAGIAHEINTPMQFISDNTQFVQKVFNDFIPLHALRDQLLAQCREAGYFPDTVKAIEAKWVEVDGDYIMTELPVAIKETISGIDRVVKLVKAMKTFSHPTQGKMQLCDLNQSIEATSNVSRNEWKYVADLKLDLDPKLPPVPCLIDELNQVVLNMITNSVDAIKDVIASNGEQRGVIEISTRVAGDTAQIIIKDSGKGMPEEVMRKIFDPFFTTKEPGKGTGQGLAISHDIIENKHQGRIEVESKAGQGTQFIITLPLRTPNSEGEP